MTGPSWSPCINQSPEREVNVCCGHAVIGHDHHIERYAFGLQTVDRSFGPVLPLYVAQVGVPMARIPIVTGVLFSLGAIAAAVGHHLAGRLMQTYAARTIIVLGSLLAAGAVAAIIAAPSLWFVGAAMLFSASAALADSGPFAGFEGAWSGTGTVALSDGTKERIRVSGDRMNPEITLFEDTLAVKAQSFSRSGSQIGRAHV